MCPTQHIDCSLMHVLISLSHKNFQLLLGMCSSNKHQIMFKWSIFNASVLLNEHGHPHFLFQNWNSHMINIQWAKFERKCIVSFISEELPYYQQKRSSDFILKAANIFIPNVITDITYCRTWIFLDFPPHHLLLLLLQLCLDM